MLNDLIRSRDEWLETINKEHHHAAHKDDSPVQLAAKKRLLEEWEKLEDELNGPLYDGAWEENAAVFEKANAARRSIMLDPDVAEAPVKQELEKGLAEVMAGDPNFDAVDPDRLEHDRDIEKLRAEVCARSSAAPPAGWRVDSCPQPAGPPAPRQCAAVVPKAARCAA